MSNDETLSSVDEKGNKTTKIRRLKKWKLFLLHFIKSAYKLRRQKFLTTNSGSQRKTCFMLVTTFFAQWIIIEKIDSIWCDLYVKCEYIKLIKLKKKRIY
jgi:hypothetical protein